MEAFRCYLDRRFSKTVRTRYVPDKTNPNAYFVYHGDELIRQVEQSFNNPIRQPSLFKKLALLASSP
jgi:hypothetical protein